MSETEKCIRDECLPMPNEHQTATQVQVTDGDTIKVNTRQGKLKIRLARIDAPETKQPYGQQSKQALANYLMEASEISIVVQTRDRYGRVVADVYADDISIAVLMIRDGHAWHYTQYDDTECLTKLQEQAKQEKRGLWANANPTPPWNWRKERRKRKKKK